MGSYEIRSLDSGFINEWTSFLSNINTSTMLGTAYLGDPNGLSPIELMGNMVVNSPLAKAMTAGVGTAPSTVVGQHALQFENLQPVYSSLVHERKNLATLRFIKMEPASSHLYQFTRKTKLNFNYYPWFSETNIASEKQSEYARQWVALKLMGCKTEVSMALQSTNNMAVESVLAEAKTDAVLRTMTGLETMFWWGSYKDDAGVVHDSLAADGIIRQAREYARAPQEEPKYSGTVTEKSWMTDHWFNCSKGGVTLSQANTAQKVLAQNYLDDFNNVGFFCSPGVAANIQDQQISPTNYVRWWMPLKEAASVGVPIDSWHLKHGRIPIIECNFIQPTWRPKAVADASAPSTPIGYTLSIDASPTYSYWAVETVTYRFSAVSQGLESTYLQGTAISVGLNQAINITVAPGATRGNSIRIYKKLASDADYRFCDEVAVPAVADVSYQDNNRFAGGEYAFMLNLPPSTVKMVQLIPFVMLRLAIQYVTIPFAVFTMISPVLENPRQLIVFNNITV